MDRVRPFIRHRVCNGVGTFLWHDFWNPLGPILPLFGERILYNSPLHRNACVDYVMEGTRWNWPVTISADVIALKNNCTNYPLDTSREDVISWSPSPLSVFTVSSAWNSIKFCMPLVHWHAVVWFS